MSLATLQCFPRIQKPFLCSVIRKARLSSRSPWEEDPNSGNPRSADPAGLLALPMTNPLSLLTSLPPPFQTPSSPFSPAQSDGQGAQLSPVLFSTLGIKWFQRSNSCLPSTLVDKYEGSGRCQEGLLTHRHYSLTGPCSHQEQTSRPLASSPSPLSPPGPHSASTSP